MSCLFFGYMILSKMLSVEWPGQQPSDATTLPSINISYENFTKP